MATTSVIVLFLVVAIVALSRSRTLSFLAAVLCVVLGYYLAVAGVVPMLRHEIADGLTSVMEQMTRLIPGIAG